MENTTYYMILFIGNVQKKQIYRDRKKWLLGAGEESGD